MPASWKVRRRAAWAPAGIVLAAAGFGCALVPAGGALAHQATTTSVTIPAPPTTTVTTLPAPTVPSTSVTVTVTSPSPPPAPPSSAAPTPQPPPPSTPQPAPPAAPPSAPSPSPGESSPGGSPGVSGGNPDPPAGSSSGAPESDGGTSATSSAGPVVRRPPDSYRPPSQRPQPRLRTESLPAAIEHELLLPFEAAARGLRSVDTFSLERLRRARGDVLSLLPFPELLGRGSVRPARPVAVPAPHVQRVLGEQAAIEVDAGDGLSFGHLPLWGLALALVSSLLLVAALVPPAVVARTHVSPASFARARQPLALAATAMLILALAGLVAALS